MLASRHHSRWRKLRQSMRATSTLKHSSNQKGLQAKHQPVHHAYRRPLSDRFARALRRSAFGRLHARWRVHFVRPILLCPKMLNALADEQWRHPEMLNASTNNAVIPKLNAPMEERHP